ncbi:MAG: hypothetical protein SF187_29795 [Deltaproteobacteria bacterium]|nr:hypothetical protein [Deltaproteobacteria bacterium]
MKNIHKYLLAIALLLPKLAFAAEGAPTHAQSPAASLRPGTVAEQPQLLKPPGHAGYVHELFLVDLAAVSVFVLGVNLESPPLAFAGLGTYALGSPFVHSAVHHRTASVWGSSLLMRTTFPIAGAFIGYKLDVLDCSHQFWCGLEGAAMGFVAGSVTAIIIDYAKFGSDHNDDTVRKPPAFAATLVPVPVRGGLSLALGGRF